MVTARQSKAELTLVSNDAADTATWMLGRTSGSWESRRLQLLDTVPDVVGYYSDGSSALAVDFYDDARAGTGEVLRFAAAPIVLDRTVKIRRGIAWATDPLEYDDTLAASGRLSELVKSEVSRPYRDTILGNQKSDPAAVGWKRIASTNTKCGFCLMLADKGAVYRESTATFAAHDNCQCTAAPVFRGGFVGPEASALQYVASKRKRTPAEKVALRDAVASYEGG